MSTAKIAISIEHTLLRKIDAMVANHIFKNRSQAIAIALTKNIARIERRRLAEECCKLDPDFEKAMAEEGMSEDAKEWPEY